MIEIFLLNDKQIDKLIEQIQNELHIQHKLYREQKHSLNEWLVILSKQFGQIAESIIKLNNYNTFKIYQENISHFEIWYKKLKHEIIQTLTVLVQMYFLKINP